MARVHAAVAASVLFFLAVVLTSREVRGSVLNVTMTQLPSGDNIQVGIDAPYLSSNYPMLWCLGQTNNYWGYDATVAAFVNTNGLPLFTFNNDHINQLYFDPVNQVIVAMMELGHDGGVGSYYLNAYAAANGTLLWSYKSLHVVPGTVGGLGGVTEGIIVAVGPNSSAFAVTTTAGQWQYQLRPLVAQVRCSHISGYCVGVHESDATTVFGFHAKTGVRRWSYTESSDNVTMSAIHSRFIVYTTTDHWKRVDTITGHAITMCPTTAASYLMSVAGPNLVGYNPAGNYQVRRIVDGVKIVDFPVGNLNVITLANYQVIVIAVEGTTNRDLHVFDAVTGAALGNYPHTPIPPSPPSYGVAPFLVESAFVQMIDSESYQVVFSNGTRTTGTLGAGLFATQNVLYLPQGTLMWSAGQSILQLQTF